MKQKSLRYFIFYLTVRTFYVDNGVIVCKCQGRGDRALELNIRSR